MFIRTIAVSPQEVTTCSTDLTAKEAYDALIQSGYRCIPVVDPRTHAYKGQVYKVHLMEHLFEKSGDPHTPVSDLVAEPESFIGERDTLMAALLRIDRLPFLAVVNERGEFAGIVTARVVLELFRDGFGMKTGGVCFTVGVGEHKGAFRKLLGILSPYNIEGAHTFDNGNTFIRRLSFTLASSDADPTTLQGISEKLEKAGFRVIHVETL